MSGSAIPVKVLGCHVLDLWVFEVSGTADLDFVLCGVAADQRDRLVDYTWLDASIRPRFCHDDSVSSRVAALVRWIERCFTKKCTSELPNVLRVYNNSLAFEYESFLSNIGADGGRRVEGLVQPMGSGARIGLSIPLLLKDEEAISRMLSNIIELYAKALNRDLSFIPHFSRVELSLIIWVATGRDSTVEVLSERIVMHIEEAEFLHGPSFTPFIHGCIAFRGLPKYSATLQHGASFMDYIPQLETVVQRSISEPIHFLTMVIGMSSFFSSPLGINISMKDGESSGGANDIKRKNSITRGGGPDSYDSLVRSAVFCVVDDATQFGFSIVMRYHDGWTLPSIEIIANQYSLGASRESTLREKLLYPEAVRRLEKKRGVDEHIDAVAVCDAVKDASFATMSFLISMCQ